MRVTPPIPKTSLQIFEEFFSRQLNVMQDTAQESGWDVFASVDRDDSGTSIGMPQIEMATFLTNTLKSKAL